MKCPECGQWNRASMPHCAKCGCPLNIDEASRLLTADLGLTSEQIYALHEACLYDNGEVNYEKVQEYITAYYENNRVIEIP